MRISVKIPSRNRPQQLLDTLYQWKNLASNPSNVEFIISADSDDETMKDIASLLKSIPNCKVFFGQNKSKQQAVNADLIHFTGDIIIQIGDDVLCEVQGWDDVIIKDMMKNFPDLDGVLHYPDGIQNENLCTHPVIGRKYFERFGYISNPAYKSFYGDNEFTEVAQHLGKIKYLDCKLLKHDHPMLGNRQKDELNERDDTNAKSDHAIYISRKNQGFDGILYSRKPEILIAVLSQGQWKAKTASCVCGLLLRALMEGLKYSIVGILDQQASVISCGRNHAAKQALNVPGLTHILFVDSDATFPVDTLTALLKHNKDVIACRTLRRMPPYTSTGIRLDNGKWILGCHLMLIKLSVFKEMPYPWFEGHYGKDGDYIGEDYDFCQKVNAFSGVYCDEELSEKVGHVGETNYYLSMNNKHLEEQSII